MRRGGGMPMRKGAGYTPRKWQRLRTPQWPEKGIAGGREKAPKKEKRSENTI